ncbi:hypothetical protein DX928_23105 [Bacillus swezeyi]|uniref:Uncharacterized protein n=1 Tax=Bacillus swezeyi TaxID=1925020 RepID=A0A5M8RHI5_9BACI|nr:hypothetical protein DX927_22865 [Bacillus swezeyi]KAA6471466.1 hypothetical protein DX928_23105 [Bacillus swezeyi]
MLFCYSKKYAVIIRVHPPSKKKINVVNPFENCLWGAQKRNHSWEVLKGTKSWQRGELRRIQSGEPGKSADGQMPADS